MSVSRKVLLAENSDTTRLTHRIMITKKTRHTVVSVANGTEALRMAELEKPDLILLDVVMPDMDGLEVCRRMRQMPVTASVPIVLLTFRMTQETVSQGLASGGTGYLQKPLTAEVLVDTLKQHLGS